MKKLFAGILFLLIIPFATAEEWTLIGENYGTALYGDYSRLDRRGHRGWIKHVLSKENQDIYTIIHFAQADCKQSALKIIKSMYFNKEGKIFYTNNALNWEYVKKDSMGEITVKFLCN